MNIQINISLDSKDNINNQNPDQVTFNLDADDLTKNIIKTNPDLPTEEQLSNLDNIINNMFYDDVEREENFMWINDEIGDIPTLKNLMESDINPDEIEIIG